METAFLLLGSNLGDRETYLKSVIKALNREVGTVTSRSLIYETEPWGYDDDKPYLNQAIKIVTGLSAEQLLRKSLKIERRFGRMREMRSGIEARNIDIDILFYGNHIIITKELIIPHPRLHLRKFVLIPMADLNADFVHPGLHKTIKELVDSCKDSLEVKIYNVI